MKRTKKSPKPTHKIKFQPKKIIPTIEAKNTNKFVDPKVNVDNVSKTDIKKQNKKKLNSSYNTRVYLLGSSIAFITYLYFIFTNNFSQLVLPIPAIYKETPIAANLDYYWKFSTPLIMRFLHLLSFIIAFYYFLYSIRCDPELSFAYCLIVLLDPYFSAHFFSSNFLFISLIISLFSFKFVFYSLTSFKRIDNKYKMIMALVCFLNGINLSIRFESFSIILVQAISTFLRAFKKKKVNKELIFAPIIMIFTELTIYFLICSIFGFPHSVSLHFEKINNFKDELKIYSFSKIFFILGLFSIILSFISNFKLSHKIFLISILISAFLSILIPIKTNDYSIQIRLLYMQIMLYTCFGIVICRPKYLCISGTVLGLFILASWIIRYKFTPYCYYGY